MPEDVSRQALYLRRVREEKRQHGICLDCKRASNEYARFARRMPVGGEEVARRIVNGRGNGISVYDAAALWEASRKVLQETGMSE